jgi:hypothetical protein
MARISFSTNPAGPPTNLNRRSPLLPNPLSNCSSGFGEVTSCSPRHIPSSVSGKPLDDAGLVNSWRRRHSRGAITSPLED